MTSTYPQDLDMSDLSRVLRPIAKASFSLLDNRPVLFNESSQKVYELNQTAAYIWCCLLDQKPTETICEELAQLGFQHAAATNYINSALRNWFRLGLLEPDWQLNSIDAFSANIGKLTINVQTSSKRLTQLLVPLFGHTSEIAAIAEDTFEIGEIDGRFLIFHNKVCRARCRLSELVPTFKAYLTEQIVLRSSPDIAFHSACLLSGGQGLLISGRPGAGKTTLSLHLMASGFDYAADDVVLIAPDGRATGVPFAPALKPGAWPIVKKFRPDLGGSAVHNRPDGKRVRYVNAPRPARSSSVSIRWIIFIKRAARTPVNFVRLDQLETMRRLIDGSYSPSGKLTSQSFHAIKRTLAGSKCFELRYSNAAEASDAIVDLCNG
jgi:hypothetical protein